MKITKKKIQAASDYRTFDAYTPEEIDEMFPDWETWASKEEIHDAELVYLPKSEENPYIGIKYPDGEIWVYGAGRDAKVSFEELCDYMSEGSGVEATVSVKCATFSVSDEVVTVLSELLGGLWAETESPQGNTQLIFKNQFTYSEAMNEIIPECERLLKAKGLWKQLVSIRSFYSRQSFDRPMRIVVTLKKGTEEVKARIDKYLDSKDIKCATSLQMLDAFEARLDELNGVDASCKVEAATNYGRETEIYGEDYNAKYEDTGAAFGGDGTEIYTLAEIKEYWNEFNETDSVLAEYPSFEMWWQDTRDNFMSEYHWD